MRMLCVVAVLAAASCACSAEKGAERTAQQPRGSSEPYWHSSETAPWYDSYGRLQHGYKDAPMKDYPPGKEPYYYSSEKSDWYDSQGRLRHGPEATDTKTYRPGTEPYYHSSDSMPWYDSYGNLRYGPRGVPADEYRTGLPK